MRLLYIFITIITVASISWAQNLRSCEVNTEVDDANTPNSLRYCFEHVADGGRITFARDMHIKLTEGGLYLYNRGITIDGEGQNIVIEAKDRDTRIFIVGNSRASYLRYVSVDKELIFKDLTLVGSERAIDFFGYDMSYALHITNIVFRNNKQAISLIQYGSRLLTFINLCTFQNNSNDTQRSRDGAYDAVAGIGVLARNAADVTIEINESTFENNSAQWGTIAAVSEDGANMRGYITASTFNDNSANLGAVIYNYVNSFNEGTKGEIKLTNSTIFHNSSQYHSVVRNDYNGDDPSATIKISNATIYKNQSGDGRYALYDQQNLDTIIVKNSIVYGNTDEQGNDANCFNVVSDGYNILGDNCRLANTLSPTDKNEDPKLAPFDNYGGPTKTLALLEGSPAIDSADSTDMDDFPVEVDQRGVRRPIGNSNDIGAVEGTARMQNVNVPFSPFAKVLMALGLLLLAAVRVRDRQI